MLLQPHAHVVSSFNCILVLTSQRALQSPYALHPVSGNCFPKCCRETIPAVVLLTTALCRPGKEDPLAL